MKLAFYLLTALLLVVISFLAFSCTTTSQKIIALIFGGYFLLLLIKKYRVSLTIVSLAVAALLTIIFFNKQEKNFVLTEQSQLKIYPDQVKIKDDYLTGIGNFAQGKVLISGKVTDAQKYCLSGEIPF